MRYVIVIEDTTSGIDMRYSRETNGVQDHADESIATHTTATLFLTMRKLAQIGAVSVNEEFKMEMSV
jgi:hypothetical protein